MPKFSNTSLERLGTCDRRLQDLFREVIKHWDCTILEGHRSPVRQTELIAQGLSKTMASKHLHVPSRAVDVAPYPVDWRDTPRFDRFGWFVLGVAAAMGIKIRWGHDWDGDHDPNDQTFHDYPHFELAE